MNPVSQSRESPGTTHAPPNHTHHYHPHPRHMPPPHRMLSRNPAEKRVPAGLPLHSNLGRHRILGHRRVHRRSLETTPTIHHPLLDNNTPPRRSSTKNHDNRRTRKLDRRRTSLHVRNQQMGPEENPRRNNASTCFNTGNRMHAIPRNKLDHAPRNFHWLATAVAALPGIVCSTVNRFWAADCRVPGAGCGRPPG